MLFFRLSHSHQVFCNVIKELEKSSSFFIACNFNTHQLHTFLSEITTFQLGRQIFWHSIFRLVYDNSTDVSIKHTQ